MEAVDVLGDDRPQQAAALQLGQRPVGGIWQLVLERVKALGVEAPEALRVATEDVDVRHLHRVLLLPQPAARRAKVRDAGGDGDARPGERHHRSPGRDQPGEALCAGAHRPLKEGLRLPAKAARPSAASAVSNTAANARRAAAPRRLICSIARGGPLANRRAQESDASSSSWSSTSSVTSPSSSARAAEIASPLSISSSARPGPMRRARRWVPPKPGMIPRLISGWPKVADSEAIRRSQPIASSQPPPSAGPPTAAIVTIGE